MKNLKSGFTLAEVAVAIGLVGVLSIATIPMLIQNTQSRQFGPALGRAVEQIELGCQNLLQTANTNLMNVGSSADRFNVLTENDVFNNNPDPNNNLLVDFTRIAPPFLGLTRLNELNDNAPNLTTYNGDDASDEIEDATRYKMNKQKSTVYITMDDIPDTIERTAEIATVDIDVNGDDAPNSFGRDIFRFRLTNNGILRPFGNADDCPNAQDGLTCSARVVRDGYRINY